MTKAQEVRKNAEYLAGIMKSPTGIAETMFRVFKAMRKAGFSEKLALEITQWFAMMIIGLGGSVDETE